ncbi:uncharacterized protein K460DRAFT_417553 [Cucurbitaria berberidis CBS 394.84]|uniref:SRR1-like domain-containing protein n=1 Tax=Cucurbitaria berberidis CBS 394.84 TaxID=1168544 RepID=A0A9P4GJR6_9PLEO|nr:uncharacterized protein K460DRAFT_417553 [Cucurbitaria berberidis CBS 394.84]KAF1846489.1 hypothetical protein K460DRAFT_417553 [Cucurbitaria berberidis CBS 394.84]
MAAESPLSQLYNDFLPENGNRVWTPEIIEAMDILAQKIVMYNKRTLLLRSISSGEQERITESDQGVIFDYSGKELRHEIDQLSSELGNFEVGEKYKSIDVFGNHHDREIQNLRESGDESSFILDLAIESYWNIAGGLSASATDNFDLQPLYKVIARAATDHQTDRMCQDGETPYSFWKRRWTTVTPHGSEKVWIKTRKYYKGAKDFIFKFVSLDKLTEAEKYGDEGLMIQWSQTRFRLTDLLYKHGDQLMNVDNIVCFGLGALDWRRPKRFAQHLAAFTIRDTLQSIQAERGIDRKIPIIAQDPAYCPSCSEILEEQLGIRAVTDFEGFRAVTKNSFIVTVAPSAPVCQIIADLTMKDGGPAAMLCDKFCDDYLAQERDPESKDGYTCDEPTRNMVDYKARCEIEDFSECESVLGISHKELVDTYPTGAEYLKKWNVDGKTFFTSKTTEADEKDYKNCCVMWALEGNINFQESAVYIRSS